MQSQPKVSSDHFCGGPPILSSERRKAKQSGTVRMPPIRHLRMMLDELEVKLDAQICLEENGRERYARRIPVERDFSEFLQSLQDLVDGYQDKPEPSVVASIGNQRQVSKPDAPRDQATVRIQLKLSPSLVRVLQAVRREQVRASELVESVLWDSTRVQDTARLAGIQSPVQAPAA
jgi:hypothetical protein